MKKLRARLQIAGIIAIGSAIILYAMANSNDKSYQRVFDGFSTLKSIVKKQPNDMPEKESDHFKKKCEEAIRAGETLHPEKQKFCAYVLKPKGDI